MSLARRGKKEGYKIGAKTELLSSLLLSPAVSQGLIAGAKKEAEGENGMEISILAPLKKNGILLPETSQQRQRQKIGALQIMTKDGREEAKKVRLL